MQSEKWHKAPNAVAAKMYLTVMQDATEIEPYLEVQPNSPLKVHGPTEVELMDNASRNSTQNDAAFSPFLRRQMSAPCLGTFELHDGLTP